VFPTEVGEIQERDRARGVADARPGPEPGFRRAGIDFDPPVAGKPIDPADVDRYRVAVVEAVEKAGDAEPAVDEKIVQAAGRTAFQVRRDCQAARSRVALLASIEQAGRELAELREQGPPASPTLLALTKNCTVEREREIGKENHQRRERGWRDAESYRTKLSSAERRQRRDRQLLAEECCPVLTRRLRELRREFDRLRDARMQTDVTLGEVDQIRQVEAAIERLRSGVLLPQERPRLFRDRIAELLIPGKRKRYDEAQSKATETRRVELLEQCSKKLNALRRRGPLHARAREQAKTLQREAAALAEQIHALQTAQLTPEAFPLTP